MSIEYNCTIVDGYVLVTASGTSEEASEMLHFIDAAMEECRLNDAQMMMFDLRELFYGREYGGTYDLAVQCIKRMNRERPLRVALLVRPERMEYARVYETIGVSHGARIKAFERPTLASVWLKS